MFEVVLLGSGSARSRARPLASRTAGGDLRPLLVLYTGHSLLIDMDGNIRPPMQRGSSRKPIRRRFAPGSAGMGDFPERFYCSAVESSRQCTHPAANSCRAGGRITSDNIPLSEPKLRPAIGPPLSRGSRLRWAMMDTLTRAG